MLTQDDFSRAIRAFVGELSALALRENTNALRLHRGFGEAIDHLRSVAQDTSSSDAAILGAAVGLLDEYVEASSDRIIKESFLTYAAEASREAKRP